MPRTAQRNQYTEPPNLARDMVRLVRQGEERVHQMMATTIGVGTYRRVRVYVGGEGYWYVEISFDDSKGRFVERVLKSKTLKAALRKVETCLKTEAGR